MSKYFDHCGNYRPPCAQQIQQNTTYANSLINNTAHLNHNQLDAVYSRQVLNRSQYPCVQSGMNLLLDNLDCTWYSEQRINEEKLLRQADKVDNIEITSKDLSPASFCSNLDLLLPEFYKNANKDSYYNKSQDQMIYNTNCSQRIEFPSCAQMNCEIDSGNKYDTISKENSNYDISHQQYYKNSYNMYNQYQDYNSYNCTDEYYVQNQVYGQENIQFAQIPNIEQQTEGSNEESDIVVEDSEDEVDYSELYNSRCIICNCFYISNGIQFYLLTDNTPLTMSTQKPIIIKVSELLGPIRTARNYLCSQCLGLINTIDHLQFKLDNFKYELTNKFRLHAKNICKVSLNGKFTNNKLKKIKFRCICKHSFYCKICHRKYFLRNIFNSHMRKHKFVKYLCDVCGKRYRKVSVFNKHLQSHCNKNATIKMIPQIDAFVCKICNMIFRTKSKLKEHENYCLGKLPFKCKYSSCNKNFTTSTKLKYHVKLKHDKKFTSICSICNIGFIKTSDYKSHMVSHSTEKKYQCTKCQKCYKTMTNLNFHMKFHNEILPFNCKICKKGFMRKEYLESHINSHKGTKKILCYICNEKFISQKNLDSHMKYHDGSIKKKTCNLCGKLTINLQDHMRSHNNLKEFNCNQCDMKFNTKSAMYKHKKRKHEKNDID